MFITMLLLAVPMGVIARHIRKLEGQMYAAWAIEDLGGRVYRDAEITLDSQRGKGPIRSRFVRFLLCCDVAVVELYEGDRNSQLSVLVEHCDGLKGVREISFWGTEHLTSSQKMRLEKVFPKADVGSITKGKYEAIQEGSDTGQDLFVEVNDPIKES